jgi:histidine ammonia-lyase
MKPSTFQYGQDQLSVGLALELARNQKKGVFSPKTKSNILKSREDVQKIVASERTVYGINTGFGSLCTTLISAEDTEELQYNLLKSHSVGLGDLIDDELVLLMLVLKIQALAQGYSGISMETLERILWHIENQVVPLVPAQGSVGASGDLAPLAHMALPLIGLGKVKYKGKVVETKDFLAAENLQPIKLGAKEGLALINGTQFIAAHAVKAVEKLHICLESADIVGAFSIEAMLGSQKPFRKELHQIRPYKGTIHVAARLRELLEGSQTNTAHVDCNRVQDPYSLRCMPQVHGASRNAWLHLKELVTIEINSVTDNPIVLDEHTSISGGNFHGQPLAMALDYLTLAASELGNIADRRCYLLLTALGNLPPLLMENAGLNSGFMIVQYTAAALASENKSLCFPASADSIPTSLGQEDHVSMGSISGRKALQVIGNIEKILGIELLMATQGFEFNRPLKSTEGLEAAYTMLRKEIKHSEKDKIFADDMQKATDLIRTQQLTNTINQTVEFSNLEHHELFRLY